MQLCCIESEQGVVAAIHRDAKVYGLQSALNALGQLSVIDGMNAQAQLLALANNDRLLAEVSDICDQTPSMSAEDVRYAVPVSGPVIGVGRNYQDHVSEGGLPTGEYPKLFFNHPNALAAHHQEIVIPAGIKKADWEAEIGVVIGKPMRRVTTEQALDYVAGYLNVNDVSAREFQFDFGPAQTSFAKSFDGFCPCGPWLVTKDEIANCQDLDVRCEVNGQVTQQSNSAYMIHSIAKILSHISQFMTLQPGYLIATGTPDGVGHFMDPPRYLNDGDVVRVSVSGLGCLENRFVREQV